MSGVRRAREFNGGDLLRLGCSGRRSGHGRWRIVFADGKLAIVNYTAK